MNAMATIGPSLRMAWDLQQNTHSVRSLNWRNVTATIQADGTTKVRIGCLPAGNRSYRLHKP